MTAAAAVEVSAAVAPPPLAPFALPPDLVGINDGVDGFESNSRAGRALKPADFVRCDLCGLRGHEPRDPDRCFTKIGMGLGQSPWMGGGS